MTRILWRIHALVLGYFWLECPICERMFSGYEWDRDGSPTIPDCRAQSLGHGVCPDCHRHGRDRLFEMTSIGAVAL